MYDTGLDLGTVVGVWITGAIVVALIARSKQLPAGGYVLLSILLSPIIGLVAVLLAGGGNRAPCWRCKESVVRGASMCPHCGAELVWPEAEASSPPPRS